MTKLEAAAFLFVIISFVFTVLVTPLKLAFIGAMTSLCISWVLIIISYIKGRRKHE